LSGVGGGGASPSGSGKAPASKTNSDTSIGVGSAVHTPTTIENERFQLSRQDASVSVMSRKSPLGR
jgi:hypothetical protein